MKKSTNNNIHTATNDIPQAIKNIRKTIKLTNNISTPMAIKMVTKLFCKPTRKKIGSRHAKFYNSGKTDTLQVRGYKVKVFKKGKGKTVFVAHGWNSYGFAMRHIVEALVESGHQVIMPDMPCHGRSSGTFVDQIEMSKVLEEIFFHYQRKNPIEQILTYSWGGTAVLLALDRINKKAPGFMNIQRMVSVSMPSSPGAIMDIFCDILDLPPAVDQGLRRNIELIANNDGRSLEAAFPIGLQDLLGEAPFDYLLLHGKEDEAIAYDNSLDLASEFPHIDVELIDGLGHIDILKDQGLINKAVGYLNHQTVFGTTYMGIAASR